MSDIKLSEQAQALKLGTYRHFKGGEYTVTGVAINSEDLSEWVEYTSNTDGLKWIRPLEQFLDTKEVDGESVPRFTYLG